MEFLQISAMEKVFYNRRPETVCERLTCLQNERVSYQIACHDGDYDKEVHFTVESPISSGVTVRTVGHVPAAFLNYSHMDDDPDLLTKEAGLFPDVLEPIGDNMFYVKNRLWDTLFVTVDPEGQPAGEWPVTIRFRWDGGEAETTVYVKILPVSLPEQKLLFTQWFHCDCIAELYRVRVFSPAWWKYTESFLRVAAQNGINLILTPVFTPPLDTTVGGERMTVQLVDVYKENGGYRFGFAKLGRWVRTCRRAGINKFEISHLFTQWGAHHAPKIMAWVDGKEERIFGWDTDASGEEYRAFLSAFLPELLAYLRTVGVDESNAFFHVSDEPSGGHLESYLAAKEGIKRYIQGYTVFDALSDYEYYEKGAVELPVIATTNIQTFLDKGHRNPWIYYCCGQAKGLSNRHMSMPLSRVRVLGLQMFKFEAMGFLQWGYNFYHSRQSRRVIDPYAVTDADGCFPSGDSFSVYPGKTGALESMRIVSFTAGLYDLRALQLLESRIGHDETVALLEEGLEEPIAFNRVPAGEAWLTEVRARVNRKLEELFC